MAVIATLTADVLHGVAPLSVLFDASGSSAPGHAITKYEFDWTNNGSYDLDSGTDPTPLAHVYAAPGNYIAKVRVTSDEPATDTETLAIVVVASKEEEALLQIQDLEDWTGETHGLLRIQQKCVNRAEFLLEYETA